MNITKNYLAIPIILILFLCFTGCGEKKEHEQKMPAQPRPSAPSKQINRIQIDNEILDLFPHIKKYIPQQTNIVFQKLIRENEGEILLKPQNLTANIILESTDSLEKIYQYYKKIIPPELFSVKHRNNKVQGVYCSYLNKKEKLHNIPMRLSVKITQPSRNFSTDVIRSQLAVIEQQIDQLERISKIIKLKEVSNDTPQIFTNDQINRLKIQLSTLTNKTTLIDLSFTYEPQKVSPKKVLPTIKIRKPNPAEVIEEQDN